MHSFEHPLGGGDGDGGGGDGIGGGGDGFAGFLLDDVSFAV